MKKSIVFILNTMGWLMLILVLLMAGIRDVGLDSQLYYELQMKAEILEGAGISEADLVKLDRGLADYLSCKLTMMDYEIEVFGQMQPAFNAREIAHLADCRTLLAPVTAAGFNVMLAIAGIVLVFCTGNRNTSWQALWLASAIVLLPLGTFALWAAADFSSAFTFFHRVLFSNDLWLLNPETDLLIRICPQSMFANMGLRIALRFVAVLLGMPMLFTLLHKLEQRKRKQNEVSDL